MPCVHVRVCRCLRALVRMCTLSEGPWAQVLHSESPSRKATTGEAGGDGQGRGHNQGFLGRQVPLCPRCTVAQAVTRCPTSARGSRCRAQSQAARTPGAPGSAALELGRGARRQPQPQAHPAALAQGLWTKARGKGCLTLPRSASRVQTRASGCRTPRADQAVPSRGRREAVWSRACSRRALPGQPGPREAHYLPPRFQPREPGEGRDQCASWNDVLIPSTGVGVPSGAPGRWCRLRGCQSPRCHSPLGLSWKPPGWGPAGAQGCFPRLPGRLWARRPSPASSLSPS